MLNYEINPNYIKFGYWIVRPDIDLQLFLSDSPSYPLTDVISQNESMVRVEFALAGFDRSEIKVYTENGKLIVEGHKEQSPTGAYISKNIERRSFKWERIISDRWFVNDVSFKDGLLKIELNRNLLEHEKRKDYQF
jgi:molecular chaperone IbpA